MNAYVKDIEKDEIRSGFLVTTDRKKIWNKEIELLVEIDRICKKHNIKYFSLFGTMLGAVRHKGFIPWDDDIDVAMMRPDYMRFVKVAAQEIKAPYFLQNTYTDSRIMNWSKIMDDSTSAIEDWDADMHQGIFVDIFPLDVVPDGTERAGIVDEMMKELWMCVIAPQQVTGGLKNGANTHVSGKTLGRILDLKLAERMNIYEDFCLNHFDESTKVSFQMSYWCNRIKPNIKSQFEICFDVDFESVKISVPEQYDEILTENFGDWRTPICSPSLHEGLIMSADIPYYSMVKNINRDLLHNVEAPW